MKASLAVLALYGFAIAAGAPDAPMNCGRFQIVEASDRTFKLDTTTGRTWIMVPKPITFARTNSATIPVFIWLEMLDTTSDELMRLEPSASGPGK